MPTIEIAEQIVYVRREISMRERVYPRWVEGGKMKAATAEREIECMKAVLQTLEHCAETRHVESGFLSAAHDFAVDLCPVSPLMGIEAVRSLLSEPTKQFIREHASRIVAAKVSGK